MSAPIQRARATIYDVAERAGVSIATVSRTLKSPSVVSPATRSRVMEAVLLLDYVPHGAARSLAAQSNEAHGLVLPELSGPYYADLLTGYEEGAAAGGDSVVLLLTEGKSEVDRAVRRLAGRVDGLVVMGAVELKEFTLAAVSSRIPVLTLACTRGASRSGFSTENVASAKALTEHLLLVHGRRRVVFVGDPVQSQDVAERYAGFVAAHEDHGLTAGSPVRSALLESEGAEVARLVASGHVEADGLVCANDELALGVMAALDHAGVDVPARLSVTGWDDIMAARYVRPALTTVRQPVWELGRLAALRMRELLDGGDGSDVGVQLPTELVVRRSCGCP